MSSYRSIKLLLLFFFIVEGISAIENTPINFVKIGIDEGLPSENCNLCFIDSENFLWFGTKEGAVRFDGYNCLNLMELTNNFFANLSFLGATEDKNGNIWFATSNGFVKYDKREGSLKTYEPRVILNDFNLTNLINNIICDDNNVLWMGSTTGLYRYYIDTDSLVNSNYISLDGGNTNVTNIYIDSKNRKWISTWQDGLLLYNEKDDNFITYKIFNDFDEPKKNNQVSCIFESSEGTLFVGTWKGGMYIVRYENDDLNIIKKFPKVSETSSGIAGDIIMSICQDKDGKIWVGTTSGLSIIDQPLDNQPIIKNYYYSKNDENSLSNNEIRSIAMDETGTLWLATSGGGINKVNRINKLFTSIYPSNVLKPNASLTIQGFGVTPDNKYIIGLQSEFITTYDPDKNTFKPYSSDTFFEGVDKRRFNTATSFIWESDDILWIGTRYKGAIKYNIKTKKSYILSHSSRNKNAFIRSVFAMYKDKNNVLWFATDNGLYQIIPGKSDAIDDFKITSFYNQKDQDKPLLSNNISDIVVDNKKMLWVSTFDKGIFRSTTPISYGTNIDFEELSISNEKFGLKSNHINCLHIDSHNKLWIGTGGDGLKYWNEENHKFVNPIDSKYINNTIFFGINEDERGRIWCSSNHGLICVSSLKNNQYIAVNYTQINGLQGNLFVKGAFLKTNDGLFLIGGNRGFNIFNPNKIEPDKFIPNIKITSFSNSGESINPYLLKTKKHTFKYKQNNVFFEFSSLDHRFPEKNRYAYKLIGLDKDWKHVNSESRNASYINLPPGDYTFAIKGTNYMGIWNETPTTISFSISQAAYKTWWAILIYTLATIGLFTLITYLRISNLKAKNSLLIEKIERKKSESLNQFKLQFFTNISHELLTPLSILSIITENWDKYLLDKSINLKNILERNINQLKSHIKKILQFRKVESGNMKLKIKELDIPVLIKNITDNYNILASHNKIDFIIEVPKHLWGFVDIEILDIILNNLLSNAFKYNRENGFVKLKAIIYEEDSSTNLKISIQDNGYGIPKEQITDIFDRYYRNTQINPNIEGIGIGLALVKNLVNLHLGDISVESELGYGTTFTIVLPISKNTYENIDKDQTDSVFDLSKISTQEESKKQPDFKVEKQINKTILVVEDNIDFLNLMKSSIKEYFSVLTASNGLEAFEIAQNNEIDLILSDYMMADMNGIELCQKIKNNDETSHIPFILITANHEESTRFKSYESGVDSFLTKPISSNIIVTRIDSLLKKKEKVLYSFKKGDVFKPSQLSITTQDEIFLEKAKAIVEKYMEDQKFSVKVLQKELSISHSKLYRKIKGILDVTPNDYIRNIKLRRAAQMLEADEGLSISEVAYSIGFNDLSYFGVCFKKQFGITPREYQKGIRNEE